MIILKLRAGLGNQLFQYAYARALALRSKTNLAIDLNWFSNIAPGDTKRTYGLNTYNLPDSVKLVDRPSPSKIVQLYRKVIAKISRDIFKYSDHKYYPRLAKPVNPNIETEVEGFWNTEKYFTDAEEIIRKELTLKVPLGIEAIQKEALLLELGKTSPLVLLHVRRGDYVTHAGANKHHGLSGLDYYTESIKVMLQKLKEQNLTNPIFMLASDDMDWVKENIIPLLNDAQYEILSNLNVIKDYEEIYLMSLCHHFIIANSSFSWWGAWLSHKAKDGGKEKIVIGPKRWVMDAGKDTSDVLPDRWIKL